MKVGFIGGGISASFCAMFLKNSNSNIDITIFDLHDVIGKKFLVTGNGRCNILNSKVDENSYNCQLPYDLLKKYPVEKVIEELSTLGIELSNIGNLYYPVSFEAKTLRKYIEEYLFSKNVKFINEKVNDYKVNENNVSLITENRTYKFDKIIIATGSLSGNKSANRFIFNMLGKHRYKIIDIYAGLCPIHVLEDVKMLENIKVKCKAKLFISNELKYEETGEVIFKKDGISGICILNIDSMICRSKDKSNLKVSLDLFPNMSNVELYKILAKVQLNFKNDPLNGLLNSNLKNYIYKRYFNSNFNFNEKDDENNLFKLATILKDISFRYYDNYYLSYSQVSIGGLYLEDFDSNFESKKEKNVYAIGEVLDVDGLCGGYNILFTILCSLVIRDHFQSL